MDTPVHNFLTPVSKIFETRGSIGYAQRMARPRKFDREEALDKALDLFWSHGFEATTMSDLQRELGIGRQSLYTTFGDKHQIFAEALDRYVTSADAMLADRFGPSAGVEAIRAHLHFGAQTLTSGDRRGCLVMNTCIELAPHDEGARLLTNRHLSALRAHFESAIETSRERGELGPSGDPD